ncbi:phosphoribosylglycinamide formyltransferase [Pseudomassariella vexata]|uniref:phosphoribosylglycinamide formyltransferase 1 n=1 Tax=Pseudomassariella vexata TaxID=1141098 RepID=A0A1Y2E598_9PEZI|nr:phosphoribosylglycinamide formyltransferase [Pseudomassariella vexata]ORY66035.1 phosphoribosylglycinamide formyltransferase [Pseudomassariella vexata]
MGQPTKPRISVLCSGSGTNLQALIDACQDGRIPGEIVKVSVNKAGVKSLERAAKAGIPTDYFNMIKHGFRAAGEKDEQKKTEGRLKYDAALAQRILADRPDLVVLAGFMHILSTAFLDPMEQAGVPIINLHPALPGKYDGAGAIERAYADFEAGKLENNTTGCMVHYVIAEVDRGAPIVIQEIVLQENERLESLIERTHDAEHGLIVKAAAKLCAEIAEKRATHK